MSADRTAPRAPLIDDLAAAPGWYAVEEVLPSVEGERRWLRRAIAAWALVRDREEYGNYATALVPDGTEPHLRMVTEGYFIHESELGVCECSAPERGVLDVAFCRRCAGIIGGDGV